ncbi:hypothetical protein COO91_01947 [Nostoc flagelliforme CCNUN1]|uniref:Uncharacterized protein n=1 Tax=Nostoc flagelliforme CCNUN1 TaxID=2038116 RepID=A0A2K8SKW3_9NOSO|nr:hypothetical protein COO91_01947 [Nostoc flagelliforme CCNUN1]
MVCFTTRSSRGSQRFQSLRWRRSLAGGNLNNSWLNLRRW